MNTKESKPKMPKPKTDKPQTDTRAEVEVVLTDEDKALERKRSIQ